MPMLFKHGTHATVTKALKTNNSVQIYWNVLENCRKFKTHHTLPLKCIMGV